MITAPDFITNYSVSGWQKMKIIVVGAGGTGSALLNKLFQMHMTLINLGAQGFDVRVFDDDTVSPSNIGRQSFWPMDLGLPKANVLVSRYNQFGGVNWSAITRKFEADDARGDTIIFGCVDNVEGRKAIHQAVQDEKNIIWIDAGNDSRSANVFLGMSAKTNNKHCYLPTVYDLFKSQMDEPIANPEPSCSTAEAIARQDYGINDIAAFHAVQMLWGFIRHGQIEYQGVTVDLRSGVTTPVPADEEMWAMFGYVNSAIAA